MVHEGFRQDNAKRPLNEGGGAVVETTRGGKWRACKEEECGETRRRGKEGGEREFEERRYTRILFQYFKRTPGYHAYPPRVDGQYLKRATNVALLVPLLPGERETNSFRRRAESIAVLLFAAVQFARLEMYGNGLPTDIDAARLYLSSRSISSSERKEK